ncbi:prolactin-releasing peptide receptor-like [Stylophora pistillata]|uniref:prolactin-releasing peptide receptor-like n=1 Tax=Stylophora pistillata TaxID=50429 RepID=UPI000C054FC1|nr:prolactin-releasing peptide receptor-like [Stylophora pistillata]
MTPVSSFSTVSTENFSSTIGGNTSSGEALQSQCVEVIKIMLYATWGLFGVLGNILTTVILSKIKAKETRVMDFYMINIALADLGTLLLAFPMTAIRERLPNDWPFGEIVCLYFLPLTDIFHGSSVWFITAAAIERYQKIARPSKVNTKLPVSLKRAQIVAVSTWVLSFVVFSLPLYFVLRYTEMPTKGRFRCGSNLPVAGAGLALTKLYFTFMIFVSYVMPLFVISGTFIAVSRKLNKSSKFIKAMNSQHEQDSKLLSLNSRKFNPTRRHANRVARNRRAKMILTPVVGIFAVFILPLTVLRLCIVFWPPITAQTFYNDLLFAVSVGVIINSSANPIIYSVVRNDFRRQMIRLLCWKRRSSRGPKA